MIRLTKHSCAHVLLATMISGVLLGCATTSGARPEDMSAKAHEEEAAREAEKAEKHADKYDPNYVGGAGADAAFEGVDFNPTESHNIQAQRHSKHAADHTAAAESLRGAEEEACESIATESRSWCPLLGPVVATEKTRDGVRVSIKEGTDVEEMVARVRCHIAYGDTQGREGMDRCPLYIEGVEVEQTGPNTIELRVKGRANVQELQERVAAHTGE